VIKTVPSISAHIVLQSTGSTALWDQGGEKGGMDRREQKKEKCEE